MRLRKEDGELPTGAWVTAAFAFTGLAVAPFAVPVLEPLTAVGLFFVFFALALISTAAAIHQHGISVGRDRERHRVLVDEPTITPSAKPVESAERIVLDVDAAFLLAIMNNNEQTTAEMQRLMKPYVGKWMRVSGPIHDLSESTLTLGNYFTRAGLQEVYLHFDLAWSERLQVQRKGASVTVFGQIVRADRLALVLKHCELI